MTALIWILLLSLFCYLFWQQSKQNEVARRQIGIKCESLGLQVISVARAGHRFKRGDQWFWHTRYQFEFSSTGDDCYTGYLDMVGFRAQSFWIPPHRM
ncbi:DUF3301 domain-containing protein [Vibrio sp.]|uniref:DUF3301 domain-containing protein n=1 Tax=Vibrio viridaestus TaxID=2487322 RepID=A0A3N9TZM6_9VIBR|nr:DUF3301 domain-containing protein [Vibrio viridaestus]MDC0610440.1 DUF3301 domain-containing protein [Vibrio sp.]RQW62422.1 DUF3301 domain-containing protein [Vibrio viridaestus]